MKICFGERKISLDRYTLEFVEEFVWNLDSHEKMDVKASEDEAEKEKNVWLEEENLLITDNLISMDHKFEKEW